MRVVNEWFIKKKEYLTLLAALIFSISLIFSNEGRQIQAIKTLTLDGYGVILEKISILKRLNAIYEENEWLRQKNAELMLESSRLKEAGIENLRLRQMLEFKSDSQLELVPAKVIGKGSNGFINSIILDAGLDDDLKKNMAVVTAQGLVGKLFNVGERHSTSQLLLDRNFRVGAMIQRSRATGIIKWQDGNQVIFAEVQKRSDVKLGDVVVTSGYSTIFPAGLKIGFVSHSTEKIQNMFMNISVHPVVDFSKLEEVFVIKPQ